MSRSEQLPDASMDEILASIRKIITDDGPDGPSGDVLATAALDDFRDAGAALAPRAGPQSYMGDLARALASGDAPGTADDDIFDEPSPAPGYARRVTDALAEAIRAPQAAQPVVEVSRPAPLPPMVHELADAPADDDADLFEATAEVTEEPLAIDEAVPLLADAEDEFIEELDDPIALGPEIELVDEVEDAGDLKTADILSVVASPPEPPVSEAINAAMPPPPPPPVLAGRATDDEAAEEPEMAVASGIAEPASVAAIESVPVEPVVVPVEAAVAEPDAQAEVAAAEPMTEIANPQDQAGAPELAETETAEPPVVAAPTVVEDTAPADMPGEPSSPESAAANEAVSVPAAAAPAVSEELMAALLKPMLKEWLDTNMPRIVAKAMGPKDDGEPQPG